MAKVSTNISLDPELKQAAIDLFSNFGLDLSTAISIFLAQAVREQRIPFEIKMDVPNDITKEAIAEYDEMKKNKQEYKRYSSLKEIVKDK